MRIFLLSLILTLLGTSITSADVVVLKTGLVLEGELVEKTDTHIKIKTETGVKKIPLRSLDKDFAAAYKILPEKIMKPLAAPLTYKGSVVTIEEVNKQDILKNLQSQYSKLNALQCQGVGISYTKRGSSLSTNQKYLTLKFQRPNFFLLVDDTIEAAKTKKTLAAWRNGNRRYFYSSTKNTYSELPTDPLALISVNYAKILYNLFWDCATECKPLESLEYFGSTKLGGQACYLFSQNVSLGSFMFWISKAKNLIVRIDYTFTGDKNDFFSRMLTMKEINVLYEDLGLELNAENKKKVLKVMADMHSIQNKIESQTFAEVIFDNILLDQELDPDHYRFFVPPGTAFVADEDFRNNFKKKKK